MRDDNFIVLENAGREDNKEFLNAYGLYRRSDQQRFLLSIDVDEFCHSKLTNDGRELFVFCAERELYKTMIGSCKVKAYIKHDYRKLNHPFDTVISMHELKLPIELLFVD